MHGGPHWSRNLASHFTVMWEDHQRESRKYVVPTANGHAHANGHHHQANGNAGHHQSNGLSAFNYGYDRTEATEDLHAWSIFRQVSKSACDTMFMHHHLTSRLSVSS